MATNQAKVQCPHCFVQFGFPLPERYFNRPTKKIKFSCAYCTEKFSQSVLTLFENDDAEIVQHKIRYNGQNGLQIFSSWEDFRQEVISNGIQGEEPISAFGESWNPISTHHEMHDLFPPSEESVIEEPVLEESVTEPVEEPLSDAPILEEAGAEPVLEESVAEPVVESPVDAPVLEESLVEPVLEETAAEPVDEPVLEESVAEPVVEPPAEPVLEETVAEPVDEPALEESPVDEPVSEEPVDEPALEESVTEPVEESPADAPILEEAGVESATESVTEPVVESPVDAPVLEESLVEPVLEETAAEPVDEPVLEESVAEPVVEPPAEPVLEETVAEPVDEPALEESPVDELVSEEPVLEESAAEPVREAAVTAEPVVEEESAGEAVVADLDSDEDGLFEEVVEAPVLEEAIEDSADAIEQSEQEKSERYDDLSFLDEDRLEEQSELFAREDTVREAEDEFLGEITGNIFEQSPSDEEIWDDEGVDPFDIPINPESNEGYLDMESEGSEEDIQAFSDFSPPSEDDELLEEKAQDVAEGQKQESGEAPTLVESPAEASFVFTEEDSEEVPPITALLSSLDESLNQPEQTLGTNTLDLIQSEEEFIASLPPEEPEPESEILIDHISEDAVDEDSLENMKTVIDDSRFLFSEEADQDLEEKADDNLTLATVSFVSEEESEEPPFENIGEKTIIGTDVLLDDEHDFSFSDRSDFAYLDEEDSQEEAVFSESVDYDQTEEEESQSILNPAFQVSTKRVAKRQTWALLLFVAFGAVIALTIASSLPITEVSKMFVSVEDAEIVLQEDVKAQKVREAEARAKQKKEQAEEDKSENDVVEADAKRTPNVTASSQEGVVSKSEETAPAKKGAEKSEKVEAIATSEVEGGSFYDDKPLSKSRKLSVEKKEKRTETIQFSTGDLEQITRQGWIKIEDRSYPSAINYFTRVVEQSPNSRALIGLGFAEELLAERYKKRNDFENVEKQYDKAHKHYCSAMDFFNDKRSLDDDERFQLNYLQARLRMISRGCT